MVVPVDERWRSRFAKLPAMALACADERCGGLTNDVDR